MLLLWYPLQVHGWWSCCHVPWEWCRLGGEDWRAIRSKSGSSVLFSEQGWCVCLYGASKNMPFSILPWRNCFVYCVLYSVTLLACAHALYTDQATKKHPFPCPTTYRHALLHYVDITSLVRTNVLKELSEYCSDEKDKQHLNNITAPTDEGKVCTVCVACVHCVYSMCALCV